MKRGPFSNQGTLICPPFLRKVRVPGNQIPLLRHHGNVPRDSDGCARAAHRGNVNNQGFGICFCYKKLNLIINNSDFIMLGLDLLIYTSDIIR